MDEMTLTLNSPLTEEDWDVLEDVDFDCTDKVWFHTKHGKDVEFVKVVRCERCIHSDGEPISDGRLWCDLFGTYMRYCSEGERRLDGYNDDAID